MHGDVPKPTTLHRQFSRVRMRGFAINNERSEKGIVASGMAVAAPGIEREL